MDNIPLPGGIVVGAPEGWDAEKQGHCFSISVQREPMEGAAGVNGWSHLTTGWRFTPEELETLSGGGAFMLSLDLPIVPVMRLWVQHPDGTVIGDLTSTTERDAAFRAAVIRIADVMARGKPAPSVLEMWLTMSTADILTKMMEIATVQGAHRIPIMRLEDIARDAAAAAGKARTPADADTVRSIAEQLGVDLNPSPLRPVDQPDAAAPPPPPDADRLFDQLAVALHALSVPLAFERGELVDAYQRVTTIVDQIEAERRHPYVVGPLTDAEVFKPAGLTNLSKPQAVLDGIEMALVDREQALEALAAFVPELPRVAERPSYPDDFVVSVEVPVGALRAARILLGSRVRQAGDFNGEGDPA